MLTVAMVDRLAHRAHNMDMSREIIYIMEDTISWSKEILKESGPLFNYKSGPFFG